MGDPHLTGRPLRLAQISDCHLHDNPGGRLTGMDTRDSLRKVLDRLQAEPGFDALLATGDLSHDTTSGSYQWLKAQLDKLDTPCYCLPGNHDDLSVMRQHLHGGRVQVCPDLRLGSWQLIFLDSSQPGSTVGLLGEEESQRLGKLLESSPAEHILICLHHQPVPVGSSWMDRMALADPERLFPLLEGDSRVRGLLWGHVHQEFDQVIDGRRMLASPSTCIQFKPGVSAFAIDPLPPGLRWLELHPDGRIESGVIRLDAIPGGLDTDSHGY